MAASLIGVKTFGTGFPTVFRVVNATATQLGENFATILLTGAPTGTFQAGESLTFGGGGTATLTQTALTSPDRLIVANLSGTISGSITGGTSGATATVSSVEGLEDAPSAGSNGKCGRGIEWEGVVYAVNWNTIYRLDESLGGSGGRWTEAYRFTNTMTSTQAMNGNRGIYAVLLNGVQTMVALWSVSSTTTYRVRSSDGASWSEAQASVSLGSADARTRVTIFNNVIYFYNASNARSFDPNTDSVANVPGFISDFITPQMAVHKNRLFVTARSSGTIRLMELVAGTLTDVHNTTISTSGAAHWTLFTGNDGLLYTIAAGPTNGFIAVRFTITTSIVSADVSNPVLPSALRSGNGFSLTDGWDVYVDNESVVHTTDNPDAEILVWVATTDVAGTTRTAYRFEGSAAEMTQVDTGGAPREIALPNEADGGGHRSFVTGELDVRFTTAPTPVLGGVRRSFRIYKKPGSSNVTSVNFRWLWRLATDSDSGSTPGRWATLANPSAGSLGLNNKVLTGLTADSTDTTPGTTYTVDALLVTADGVPNFSRVEQAPVVYV